jgi:hypothetical protein
VTRTLLGDSERDQLVSVLREHYAVGRLSLDELRRRAGIVYASTYRDEALAALTELPLIAMPGTTSEPLPPLRTGGRDGLEHADGQEGRDARVERGPRRRGHAQVPKPEPGWMRTDERFRDPSSGQIMRVWIDPTDASRHYAPDD